MRREMRSKWLQTACLNVVIAAVCYNPPLSILLLQRPLADTGATLLSELIRRWLDNASRLVGYSNRTTDVKSPAGSPPSLLLAVTNQVTGESLRGF